MYEALKLTVQIMDILEVIHLIGYTHNDIKLSNIMLNDDLDPFIIDFGFAKKCIHKKEHIEKCFTDHFQGNMMCASIN